MLALAALYLWRLGVAALADPDEGRYAEIAREMLARHDFLAPHLNGVPYFEKPPLVYWMLAGSLKLFGANEFAARLPIALLMLFAVGAIGWMAEKTRPGLGWLVALIAGLNLYSFILGRLVTLDAGLACFTTLAGVFLWRAVDAEERQLPHLCWTRLGYFSCALGVLIKGFIALLPGAGFGLYLIWVGRFKRTLKFRPWEALLLLIAVAAPWAFSVERHYPGFLRDAIWEQQVIRFVHGPKDHDPTPWKEGLGLIAGVTLLGLMPWTLYLVRGARDAARGWRVGGLGLYALCQWLVVYLFVAASATKLATYLLPAWPWAAVLAALAWSEMKAGWGERLWLGICAIFAGAGLPYAIHRFAEKLPESPPVWLTPVLAILGILAFIAACLPITPARRLSSGALTALALAVFAAGIYPAVAAGRTQKGAAKLISTDAGLSAMTPILMCNASPSLQFYLRRNFPLVRYGIYGELRGGFKYLKENPEIEQDVFVNRFNGPQPLLVIADWDCLRGMRGEYGETHDWPRPFITQPPLLLSRLGDTAIILNHRPESVRYMNLQELPPAASK